MVGIIVSTVATPCVLYYVKVISSGKEEVQACVTVVILDVFKEPCVWICFESWYL